MIIIITDNHRKPGGVTCIRTVHLLTEWVEQRFMDRTTKSHKKIIG